MKVENNKLIAFVGDIHGLWGRLFDQIERYDLNNAILIAVGDLGVGFKFHEDGEFKNFDKLNETFKERDIIFLGIRGNHDDPKYFKGNVNYSNFKLLPDYTQLTLNGEKFLFVGGAISIDRIFRRPNHSYWYDEEFVLDPLKVQECDVLVTHSAPTWIGPFDKEGIIFYCQKDFKLWEECVAERKAHDRLIRLAKPKKHYCGHFHLYSSVEHEGCYSTILDELQIKEHGR